MNNRFIAQLLYSREVDCIEDMSREELQDAELRAGYMRQSSLLRKDAKNANVYAEAIRIICREQAKRGN